MARTPCEFSRSYWEGARPAHHCAEMGGEPPPLQRRDEWAGRRLQGSNHGDDRQL
jgi:hypothetical protein